MPGWAGRPRSSECECRGRGGPARPVGANGERRAVIEVGSSQKPPRDRVRLKPDPICYAIPLGLTASAARAFEENRRRRRRHLSFCEVFDVQRFSTSCSSARNPSDESGCQPRREPMPHLGAGDPGRRDLAAPRVFFQTSPKSPSANPVVTGLRNPIFAVLANIRLERQLRDAAPAPARCGD